MVGTVLGPYQVVAKLGEGGMGEVYRARDRKLDRDVAIKVLPPHLGFDRDAAARFEREAKALASLAHPNILAIYDFGQEPDAERGLVPYAVMELLEGETLRQRLAGGALPARKLVQIGVEMATGLAAAHSRGIVHRDVKPENVFITTDGRVKLLDFGLAQPVVPGGAATEAPTTVRATDPGTVLGTVGYMSPEQVKGQLVDHRTDIFSLGCVLYEMATGRRAFDRDTAAETLSAILRDDPPAFGVGSGDRIEPVIRHCLEKQADERFQSARDLAFALQASGGAQTASGPVVAAGTARISRGPLASRPAALLAGIVALVGLAFLAGRALGPRASRDVQLFATFERLTDDAGVETDPAISPDGSSLAFASRARGTWDIYVQRVGGRNAIVVAGDPARDEAGPAFSPDGGSIAYHELDDDGGIFVAGATGESARRVTDFGFHPAWSPDGQRLVFCTEQIDDPASRGADSSLWVVDAAGGEPRRILETDAVQPAWSPSGRRIAFWAAHNGQRDLYTVPADGGAATPVTSDAPLDWGPTWSPDGAYLYFSSDRGGAMNLWRIAIDEATGAASGEPEPVTAGVGPFEQPRLSADGRRLVFRVQTTAVNPVALSFDPVTETIGPPRQILDRSGRLIPTGISPDGQWLALWNQFERQEDVFVIRTDGTGLRRLTDDAFRDRRAAWSPDGGEVAFSSNRGGSYAIWAVKPDGSGLRQLTREPADRSGNLLYPTYSPTGDRMVASRIRTPEAYLFDPQVPWSRQSPELLSLSVSEDRWLVPTAWSPDGRRIAGAIVTGTGAGTGLAVFELATHSVRSVVDLPVFSVGFSWLPDSRRLLFTDLGGKAWLVDVDSGRRRELLLDFRTGTGLLVSPDGRTVYTSIIRDRADLWLAEVR